MASWWVKNIALLAPTPSAMRKLLAICDEYATQCDTIFNAEKSEFMVIAAHKLRSLYQSMCDGKFYICSRVTDNVAMYSHLRHNIPRSVRKVQPCLIKKSGCCCDGGGCAIP